MRKLALPKVSAAQVYLLYEVFKHDAAITLTEALRYGQAPVLMALIRKNLLSPDGARDGHVTYIVSSLGEDLLYEWRNRV